MKDSSELLSKRLDQQIQSRHVEQNVHSLTSNSFKALETADEIKLAQIIMQKQLVQRNHVSIIKPQ